jgi:hypothetical protein
MNTVLLLALHGACIFCFHEPIAAGGESGVHAWRSMAMKRRKKA